MDYEIKSVSDLTVGDRAQYSRTITDAELAMFAGVIGERSPLHHDHLFCQQTRFGRPTVYGLLIAGYISTAVGKLGGPTGLYVKQELNFRRPVFVGDTIFATVTITSMDATTGYIDFQASVENQEGVVVVHGPGRLLLLAEVRTDQ